eukprot:Phypoly_transcript_05380.p1 GENE.Phypoly_transcript_05380~~Phypoly_transcript_05380.p1  ORF type:complete len:626 (-),score=154.91 Phypoly_transcript_05380:96-1862(-)
MATFKSFDADGDNSLSKDELSNILYRISNGQTLEEIDQEVDDIIEACDKDKSGQISYVEFFASQKRHDFSPRAQAALDKLTNFMKLQEADKKKIIKDNDENFVRLIQEKEQAILREQREKDEADRLAKLGSPHSASPKIRSVDSPKIRSVDSPKITSADGIINESNIAPEEQYNSHNNIADAASTQKEEEVTNLLTALNAANERIAQLEQALAKLEQSSTSVQQELHDKLSAADKSMKQIEEDRTKSIQELEQSLEVAKKDLGTSQALNEQIADDNKKLREDKSVEGLRAKVRELEASNSELRGSLDLARKNNPDNEVDETMAQLRLELSEEKEAKEEGLAKIQQMKVELESLREKMEKSAQNYTARLQEEKVAHKELQIRFDELHAKYSRLIQSESQLEADSAAFAAQLNALQSDNTAIKGNLAAACQEVLAVQQRVQEEERKAADAQRSAEDTQRKAAQEIRAANARTSEKAEEVRRKQDECRKKDEEIARKDDQIAELRNEVKQMQLQNLNLSNSAILPPKPQAKIDEEVAEEIIRQQRENREKIADLKRSLHTGYWAYFVWVILVLVFANIWAPECADGFLQPM